MPDWLLIALIVIAVLVVVAYAIHAIFDPIGVWWGRYPKGK